MDSMVIKMRLKEQTTLLSVIIFFFFNLALFYFHIFPICGLFLDKTGAPTPNISVHYQLCTETTNLDYNCFILHPTSRVKFDYQSKIVSLTFLEWNFWEAPSDRAFKKSASDVWPIISRISVGLKSDSQESV